MALRYAPPEHDEELRAYLTIGFQSLVGTPLPTEPGFFEAWKERTLAHGRARVMTRDGTVLAGLIDLDLGMFFGGRSVPMAGVSLVATAPEHRGRDVAGTMMRSFVQEAHARGVALSGLFPAANGLYRSVGYGFAGFYGTFRLPLAAIRARSHGPASGPASDSARALVVRVAEARDHEAMRAIYRARAEHANGMLDRSAWVWRRILDPIRGGPAYVYVVEPEAGGAIEGYVSFTQAPLPSGQLGFELQILDVCAATGRAHEALLGLLGAHRSVVTSATLHPAPADPLIALLDEQPRTGLESRFDWMLRVTDLPAAFAARGFPRGVRGALHLDVVDEIVPENAGRWIVDFEGGEARARRGGEGRLQLHVRTLATLYAGYRSAWELARASAITGALSALSERSGESASLALAAEAFAGPMPFLVDMF